MSDRTIAWTPRSRNSVGSVRKHIAPIAREVMVDSMNDPAIFLDYGRHVVDVNPAAEKLIRCPRSDVVGRLIENAWPNWPRVSKVLEDKTLGVKEISFGTGNTKRLYDVESIRLPGFRAEQGNLLIILRDVTDQKKMEEKLRLYSEHLEQLVEVRTADLATSERKYRLILDNMADSVFTINLEGDLTFVSPQTEDATGYTPQQLLSMNIRELVAPEDLPTVMKRLEMRSRGESGFLPLQFSLIRADGTRRWVEIHTKLLTDEIDRPIGVQGVARDVTERMKMEVALKESETKFRELADLLPQPLFEIDREAKFTLVNRAGFMLTGYTEEDLRRGVSAFELVASEEREKVAEAMLRVIAGEPLRAYEFTVARKDGTTFPTIIYANRIMRGNDVVGLRAVAIDISERKRMEEALRHSEARFRELANMLPQIVFETDLSGNYTFANRSGLVAGGYTEEEALNGLNAFQTFAEQDRGRAIKNIGRILRGEDVGPSEYTALRKDGSTFPVLVHSTPIVREGKVVGVRGIAMDITEQKRMEEDLLRAKHLAAVGEAAAMVGHDLRNPLQTMTTTLYLAEKLMRSERPENIGKALELLEELNAEVYYMDKIVSDLQDYARPVDIQLEEIDLVDVIRDIGLSTKIPGTVKVSVPVEGEPLKAIANPLLLRRVLVNLILNAVQAMPKGGKLTISTGDVQGGAAISVQDTGTGIPAESLDRIFNPFFTTKARGQGLGLTVCKRLVEAQGGEIAVKSEVGKGSTFTVKLRTHLTKDVI